MKTILKNILKKYQLPAITNLGTSFGMGLIVSTFMIAQAKSGDSFFSASYNRKYWCFSRKRNKCKIDVKLYKKKFMVLRNMYFQILILLMIY